MLKVFSLPILVGIGLGVLFPYQSLSLVWTSSIILFFLLFLNTLAVDAEELRRCLSQKWPQCLLTLGLVFVFLPLLTAAATRLWIADQDFAYGLIVSSLAPCALVNPFFARIRGGDSPLSLLNVVATTLICPFITIPMLNAYGFSSVYLDAKYTAYFLGSLTVFPLIASMATTKVFPHLPNRIIPYLPPLNSILLAFLMFILVGSSLNKIPLRLLGERDVLNMIVFFLVSDFVCFVTIRFSAALFVNKSLSETLALSVSSRNFAVSAGLMLFFHPKAALPSAIGLMIHAIFFQWLVWKRISTVISFIGISLFALAISPHANAEITPARFCVSPYNEEAGVAQVLGAHYLGFLGRRSINSDLLVKDDLIEAVAKGECDLALLSVDQLLNATISMFSQTIPIFEFNVTDGRSRLFVLKESKIARIDDLVGKSVRVAGKHDQLQLERFLSDANISKKRVRISNDIRTADLESSLADKSLDAAFASEPLATLFRMSGKYRTIGKSVFGKKDLRITTQRSFVAANRKFVKTNTGVLSRIRQSLNEAYIYLERNPSRQVALLQGNSQTLKMGNITVGKKEYYELALHLRRTGSDLLIPSQEEQVRRTKKFGHYLQVITGNRENLRFRLISNWLNSF